MLDDLFATEEEPSVCCLDCAKFAGRSRDRWAILFMAGKGYCDDDQHPGGAWNVIQDIVCSHRCKRFVRADENVIEQRRAALKHYGVEERMAERRGR